MGKVGRVKVGFSRAMQMLIPYVKRRVMGQVRSVALIVAYLIVFQLLVLQMPIAGAGSAALGIVLVIFGLTFFMEGLMIGLMPLGELLGVQLPQKTTLTVILAFAFVLGIGATFAEPAIGVLRLAGSSVRPWEAPLLFFFLNEGTTILVASVGIGVGIAVLFGMLRFMYSWSLKPFLFTLIPVLLALTIIAFFIPNMRTISGLAWDTGGVTTGPVTVPLVLALGIGISRMSSSSDEGGGGFGVVTLASAFPIIMVLSVGFVLNATMPQPASPEQFFAADPTRLERVFGSGRNIERYIWGSDRSTQIATAYYGDNATASARYREIRTSDQLRAEILGPEDGAQGDGGYDLKALFMANGIGALQAILPLTGLLLLVFFFVVRERLPNPDEIALGIGLAVVGMALFSGGIELGLANMGRQVGSSLPVLYQAVEDEANVTQFTGFDDQIVREAIRPDGVVSRFIFVDDQKGIRAIPYDPDAYDRSTDTYRYVPRIGPLFPGDGDGLSPGLLLVLLFAFIMGYAATLAEPALNALGMTVEDITAGVFKKSVLMQTVAIGVAVGITVGIMKILWDIPLIYILLPPYVVLMIMTAVSSEDYVDIAWDSAGVTTGPVTVPLVLALGLGIGSQVGIVEGFGILSAASVFPIMSVLLVGLVVTARRRKAHSHRAAGEAR
ncbi:MAG: DUF1538 domain-containing protein [Spirochaetaceae bacterium]|nr:MAG: DUF1538 domain-containing protein [Spirochaetaceae bacterium]